MLSSIKNRQSELSGSTAAIFLVALADSIFIVLWGENKVIPAAIWNSISILCAVVVVGILSVGSRLTAEIAVLLVSGLLAALVAYSWITHSSINAIVAGMFVPIIGVYLMWFNNLLLARAIIVLTLVSYGSAIIVRFGETHYILVFTVAITTILASEVIRRLVDRLQQEILVDPLTKIWNRRGLQRYLATEVKRAKRNNTPLSLLYIDLDDFKLVNDTAGHDAGDLVLIEFVEKINDKVRPSDTFARMGGDEFLLVLPETSRHAAEILAQRIQHDSPIKWSYGISQYREGENLGEFITRADSRLIEEKAERKTGR